MRPVIDHKFRHNIVLQNALTMLRDSFVKLSNCPLLLVVSSINVSVRLLAMKISFAGKIGIPLQKIR